MDNSQTGMMRPVKLADTYYYGVWPTICRVTAEMDDMSVTYPTQGMYDSMLDRVYDEVSKMYPEEMPNQASSNNSHAEQFFPPFRRRRLLRDLLGILLLEELLGRRRRFW